MLNVLGCVTGQHDVRLVGVAALVCGLACITSISLFERGMAAERLRAAWGGAVAVTFGGGVWATHFVAMLAYRPGLPFGFAVPLTLLSLVLPMLGVALAAFLVARSPEAASARLLAGTVIGVSIAAMHFTGMAALRIPARIDIDLATCAVATGIGIVFATLAMLAHRAGGRWTVAALLFLAVCGMHLTAMSAVALVPDGAAPALDGTLDPAELGLGIAVVAMLILGCSLFASMLDARRARHLQTEARRLRMLLDATFEGILFHRDGTITEVNARLCALLGRDRAGLVGARVRDVLGDAALPAGGTAGEAVSLEAELRDTTGATHPVELLARPLTGGEHVVAVRDLTERKRAEQRIRHLAHHDALTGLANRPLLGEIARQLLSQADRARHGVALLRLDLDGFKAVNDLLGYHVGDLLLAAVADRLAGAARQMDSLARLGGDEFAILQPIADEPRAAGALAERVVRLIAQPFEIGANSIAIGVSVGIALYPTDAATLEDLLRHADLALQRAKQDGKGTWRYFETGMDARMRDRRQLEVDLRAALDGNQFEAHYQAQFDTATLAEIGYEALLRWNHPRLGRVSPAVFIPIAEESGLIRQLGHWVLETACHEAAGWDRPLRLSVNLSPAQFKWHDLPRVVLDILDRTGLPPGRLELEVTEGVLIDDTDRALAILRELKGHGVRIALDDFGTGYASLSYLRRFPFDSLKIDKSFVQAIGEDAEADAIVGAMIGLGRSLNLDVIAEGVETPAQLAHLAAHKCHEVQGFLLARPVPAADIRRAKVAARA